MAFHLFSYLVDLCLIECFNLRDLLQIEIKIVTEGSHFVLPLLDSAQFAAKVSVPLEHLLGDVLCLGREVVVLGDEVLLDGLKPL